MKTVKLLTKTKDFFMRVVCLITVMLITTPALANDNSTDVVGNFMTQSLQGIFGSSSGFWKMFILADIGLATIASVKSKNPMVFAGVFMTALIPGFLVKSYVFPAA